MGLLIKHARIVNAGKEEVTDLYLDNQRIDQIGNNIRLPDHGSAETIDARGMYVIPGGIDPHVHMHLLTAAGFSSDDFFSGSQAALHGGTTTLIDFVTPKRGMSLVQALDIRKQEAEGCLADYSLHVSPVEWSENTADEIRTCVGAGITSFKIYMAYKNSIGIDYEVMEKVMQVVADAGAMVLVHCETGEKVDALRNKLASEGFHDPAAHPLSRPPQTESGAVKKAIALSDKTGCPLYIVHVSAAESVELIRKAKRKGSKVRAEVCPHHLLLDQDLYNGPFESSAPYVLSPPLRQKMDREALWDALEDGTIDVVATDHCPFYMKHKEAGKNDFRMIANGAGGVEHRLALLYTYGVLQKRISLQQLVNVCATAPAKIFGMYPQKGLIDVGSDADLVIWDPDAEQMISASTHHQNSDINIYEGMKTCGRPKMVIREGVVVLMNGKIIANRPGTFLKRFRTDFTQDLRNP